ncbi:MAG TPA: hypothetical protein PK771_05680 [Spirochaetota bacterium]|nr:hypothetical protein [Spirochaetota bacterium]
MKKKHLFPIFMSITTVIILIILLNLFKKDNLNNFKLFFKEKIILLNLFLKNKDEFNKIVYIKVDNQNNIYIGKKNQIKKELDFLSLNEGDSFSELYLKIYKIQEYSHKSFKLVDSNIKILSINLKDIRKINNKMITIKKNDIDTIKSKIDKINNDLNLEIEKLKARYEKSNREAIKKINNYLKKSSLSDEVKSQIYSVFNNEINQKNIPEFIIELINYFEKNTINEKNYDKEVRFFKQLLKESITIDKKNDVSLYDIIYNKKIYFEKLEIVIFDFYEEKYTLF